MIKQVVRIRSSTDTAAANPRILSLNIEQTLGKKKATMMTMMMMTTMMIMTVMLMTSITVKSHRKQRYCSTITIYNLICNLQNLRNLSAILSLQSPPSTPVITGSPFFNPETFPDIPYLSTDFGRRAFSYSSLETWNSFPTSLKIVPPYTS